MAKFRISKDGQNFTVTAPDEATAMSAMGLGGGSAPAPQEEGTLSKYAGAIGSGLVSAAAGVAELPVTAARLVDKVDAAWHGEKPLNVDWNYWSPMAAADKLLRPEGDGQTTYDVVKNVAPFVAGSAAVGKYGGKAIDKGLQLLKDTGTAGASVAGATAGSVAGNAVGGDLGGEIGAIIGGGVTPALPGMVKTGGKNFLVDQLTDDKSLQRWRAVERLNKAADMTNTPEAKIPLSLGLVGSKTAGVAEDATAGTAFGGAPAMQARRAQYSGMDQTAKAIADEIRGAPAAGEISRGSIGEQVAQTARDANTNFRDRISARQDALENAIGPVPVDVSRIEGTVRNFVDDPNVGIDLKGAPESRMSQLNRDRNIPVDPALQKTLQQQHDAAMLLAPLAAKVGQLPRLLQFIQDIKRQMWDNTGVRYGALKDWRTVNGQSIDGMPPISTQIADPMYERSTEAMRLAAILKGKGSEFDAANAEAARLHQGAMDPSNTGQRISAAAPIPVTDRISSQPEGTAYNSVFSPSNTQSSSILDILSEGAPDATRRLLADNFELKTRGLAAGVAEAKPESLRPKRALDWLSTLPFDSVQRYIGGERLNPADYSSDMVGQNPEMRTLLGALSQVLEADARRPTRTLPGQGGNTLGAPSMFYNSIGGGAGAAGGAFIGGPVGAVVGSALGAMAPGLKASLIGKLMTNADVTRSVVNSRGQMPGAMDIQRLLPMLAAGAAGNPPAPVEQQ